MEKQINFSTKSLQTIVNSVGVLGSGKKLSSYASMGGVQFVGVNNNLKFYSSDGSHICIFDFNDPSQNFDGINCTVNDSDLKSIVDLSSDDFIKLVFGENDLLIYEGRNTYTISYLKDIEYKSFTENVSIGKKFFDIQFGFLKKIRSLLRYFSAGRSSGAGYGDEISSAVFYDGNLFSTNRKSCVIVKNIGSAVDPVPISSLSLDLFCLLPFDDEDLVSFYDAYNMVVAQVKDFKFVMRLVDVSCIDYNSRLPKLDELTKVCCVDRKDLRLACKKVYNFTNKLNFFACSFDFKDSALIMSNSLDGKSCVVSVDYKEFYNPFSARINVRNLMRLLNHLEDSVVFYFTNTKNLFCIPFVFGDKDVLVYEVTMISV